MIYMGDLIMDFGVGRKIGDLPKIGGFSIFS
jgi:hypothetical protein